MNFFQWSINDPLEINKYGIPEPISNRVVCPHILLVPLARGTNKIWGQTTLFEIGSGIPYLFISSGSFIDHWKKFIWKFFFIFGNEIW